MDESKVKWEQFLSGNYDAYTWIYYSYAKTLYSYGSRFVSSHEIVEDAIQELFLTLYKNRNRLRVPENVKLYLLVSMKHNLIRAINKEERYEPVTAENIPFL
ncbi:MAG: hypothetical protein LUE98_17300 [Tannerellaceae bacterium]|nr:hypothetical protein [Tannerellaceae bacterium]